MNAPGPAGERAPADAGSTSTRSPLVDTVPRLRREAPLPPWPPEPFPSAAEEPRLRPASVRVLTHKVAAPPVQPVPRIAATIESSPRQPETASPTPPEPRRTPATSPAANAPQPTPPSWEPRRGRRRRTAVLMLLTLALAAAVGGVVVLVVTRHDADHTGVPSATTLAPTTTAAPTTTVPATTVPSTTTSAPAAPTGPNVLGVALGTPADGASALPQERYAAHLGHDETAASPASPALVYAMWWELFGAAPATVVASPNGFSFADGNGQTIELTAFVPGADGLVADLVECASVPGASPTCNQMSNVVSLDATTPMVGQSANVTFTRLAEMRLLRDSVVRFMSVNSTQPVTTITSPAGAVRFNDHVVGIELPAGAVPTTVDLTLTYADGTSETVTVTV